MKFIINYYPLCLKLVNQFKDLVITEKKVIFYCQDLTVPDTAASFELFHAIAQKKGLVLEARVGRGSVSWPALRGDREGLLCGFLGQVEVAEEADQCSEDASPLIAEGLLEDRYRSTSGRTSIAPPMLAAGIREATSIAASRSSASKKQ